MSKPARAVVWFRQDLRLSDNLSLHHAFENGYEIIPLFILEKGNFAKSFNIQIQIRGHTEKLKSGGFIIHWLILPNQYVQ